jgi:hypothetical protein
VHGSLSPAHKPFPRLGWRPEPSSQLEEQEVSSQVKIKGIRKGIKEVGKTKINEYHMSMILFICLLVCLSIICYLSSMYLSLYLTSIFLSYLSIYYLSIYYLSIYLSIHLDRILLCSPCWPGTSDSPTSVS